MKVFTAGPCTTCGYVAESPKSPKLAQRSLNAHSCAKHLARAAQMERGAARRAAVDRAPKPCTHRLAEHQHGTHACYVLDRCRCTPCSRANRDYERDRAKRHAYGRFDTYVDAEPVRAHVRHLMAAGIGTKRIAQVSGASHGSLTKLLYGGRTGVPSERVTRPVAERVLAVRVTLDTYAPRAHVPNVGTKRRLQALMTQGWSQSQLARQVGMEVRNFNHLLHGKRAVTAKNARAVAALYDELWDQAPPADDRWAAASVTRSRNYAAAHGFAPPMAWDDDVMDDPAAVPDLGATTAPARGRPNQARRPAEHVIEDIEWLLTEIDPMATAEQLSHRLGYADRSGIQTTLARAGRRDLLDLLVRNAELIASNSRRTA